MVQKEFIKSSAWILEVKLDHFDLIGEDVDRNVDTLRDGDEFFSLVTIFLWH